MTKNNDGRKHWRKGTGAAVKFLRKAWENFGATVLAELHARAKHARGRSPIAK